MNAIHSPDTIHSRVMVSTAALIVSNQCNSWYHWHQVKKVNLLNDISAIVPPLLAWYGFYPERETTVRLLNSTKIMQVHNDFTF